MKLFSKSFVALVAVVGLSLTGSGVGFAASIAITAIGADAATQADWRTTTIPKPFDLDHNDVYGSLGYTVYSTSPGRPASLPSWLSVTANGVAAAFATTLYPSFDDPAATPGPTVADIQTGISYRQDVVSGTLYNINFGAGTPAGILRVGVIQNGAMHSQISYTLADGLVTATQAINSAENDGIVRYAFFNITDAAQGDVVTLSGLISSAAGTPNNGLSGITFDFVVPEPASMSMLAAGGLMLIRRRRR